jgi:hypothetical protein
VSLERTEPWLNRTHQAFAALCWWGLPAEIRSLGVPLIMVPDKYLVEIFKSGKIKKKRKRGRKEKEKVYKI